jgi:protein SCO1
MLDTEFDRETPEDRIADVVDAVRRTPEERDLLVRLLPEQLPLYDGRGANQVIRMRGYILAAFEDTGLPESAFPYVLEELQSGRDAYLVAAAAKAVRGLAEPTAEWTRHLLHAIDNIRPLDDTVSFDGYKASWPAANPTTALREIFRTLGWLGEAAREALPALDGLLADGAPPLAPGLRGEVEATRSRILGSVPAPRTCCAPVSLSALARPVPTRQARPTAVPVETPLQDQDGMTLRFGEFFTGKPTVLAFFYTRCTNPDKCSATITKLGRLQQSIREAGLHGRLRTAALTYDPHFDLPPRLRAYGAVRGVAFDEDNRFLRTVNDFATVRQAFDLGVGYTGTTVNRHRIELYVLDPAACVAAAVTRTAWDVSEVLDLARVQLRSC